MIIHESGAALQGKDVNSRFTLYEKEDSRWKISIIVQNIFMLGKKYLCYTLHINEIAICKNKTIM